MNIHLNQCFKRLSRYVAIINMLIKAMGFITAVLSCLPLEAWAQPQTVKPYLQIETGAHTAPVGQIAIDSGEQFLVSASGDKTARIWDLHTGKLLRILRPPIGDHLEGALKAAAISPDGATVAVGGITGSLASGAAVYIFDRVSGDLRRAIMGLPNAIFRLQYSTDGRYLAAGLAGNSGIRVFETAGYSEVAKDTDYGDIAVDLQFDKSGRLASASVDGFIRLYNSQFHLVHKSKPRSSAKPATARFSRDGRWLAIGFFDAGAVDILSAQNLSFQYSLRAFDAADFETVLWLANQQTVCAAGKYTNNSLGAIACWDGPATSYPKAFPATGNTILDIRGLNDGAIAFAGTDTSVGVLDPSGSIRWRARSDVPDFTFSSPLRVSSDADVIEFSASYLDGTSWLQHTVRFSVADRRLEIDPKSEASLLVPITAGLSIEDWQNGFAPTLNGRPLQFQQYDMSRNLAISPGKDSFVLCTSFHIIKYSAEGQLIWHVDVPAEAMRVNISTDGHYVVAALADGTIRWYTLERGVEVLTLFIDLKPRRWIAWNPDGFFTFENGGDALIGYQINHGRDKAGEFIKADQLRSVFYQPDLVSHILQPGGAEDVLAARNRLGDIGHVLSGGSPQEIELLSPAQQEVTGDEYLLRFRIKSQLGRHGRIVYRIDGTEIEGRDAVDIKGTGSDTINRYIPVGNGSHTLAISVFNENGKVESKPVTVQISKRQPTAAPNLYVIAVGISHYSDNALSEGVKFASNDADLLAARFKEQEGLGLYRKVTAVSLPDRQATIKNIQDEMTRAAKVTQPGDVFIMYLAGHAITVEGEYYFIPWEAEYTNQEQLLKKSLSRENIQELLKQIPTNKSVLILDTCVAGGYLQGRAGGNEKAAIEKIASMSGRAVLGASNSEQMAMDGYQNHGVFTFALLQGLQHADSNIQGDILISRLAEFVQGRVPVLAEEKWHYHQTPVFRMDGEPFPIAHKPSN